VVNVADEPNTVVDGYLSMEGGVDSGFVPSLLGPNQNSWAINTTCRGGYLRPRPGFKYREITYPDSGTETNATEGLFQGAGSYIADNGDAFLAYSVSGRIFTVQIGSFALTDISITGDLNSATKPHAWFQQAENTLVIQNETQAPLFWDGTSMTRSVVAKQVPVGGPMAYLKGRLWVARDTEFFGGDLVNSYPALGRKSVLQFEENTFLAEGGAFAAKGKVTGLAVAANIDTQLGDGELMIFTRDTAYAFNAPADRTLWKNLRYPIQRIALLHAGSLSQECIVNVNADLIFRSLDGINSFRAAKADFEQWGNTPISRQVERGLAFDTESLLSACSGANFDNRLLMTIQPHYVYGRGVWHAGLVALDYHLVSGMGRKTEPAWEGVWTGLKILRIINVNVANTVRCFVFALDDENRIRLWELTKANRFDVGPDGEDVRIKWSPETRSFTYGRPRELKRLIGAEQWYDLLTGQLDVKWYYRPNLMECWTEWATWSACAKYKECDAPPEGECQTVQYFRQQVRPRMAITQPADVPDLQTNSLRSIGYEFQFKLELTGYARLNRLITLATMQGDLTFGDISGTACVETPDAGCDDAECKTLECGCDPNDFAYLVPSDQAEGAYITGRVTEETESGGDDYQIYYGRVGIDAAGTWITEEASLQSPQFLFWGGLELLKLSTVTQMVPDGDFVYTSVVGGTLSNVSYNGSIAVVASPWTDSITLPQFSSLTYGEAVSCTITCTTIAYADSRVENLEATPQTITIGIDGHVEFSYPIEGAFITVNSSAINGPFAAAAYDGVTNYAGTSGADYEPLSNNESDTVIITDADAAWPEVIGEGNIEFGLDATAEDAITVDPGPQNLSYDNEKRVGAELTVRYDYHPFEGYWIYVIDDAAPWSPTSFKKSDTTDLDMATLADLGGAAENRGEINGFGYELVEDFSANVFKLFRSKYQVPAGGDTITVVGTVADPGMELVGVKGAKVRLNLDGNVVETITTPKSGEYAFLGVSAGSYVVSVLPPTGYSVVGDDEIPVTVTAGQTDSGNDFSLQADP